MNHSKFTCLGGAILLCILLHGSIACLAVSAADTPSIRIRIIFPPDGMRVPAVDRLFVFGSVEPPGARVRINGIDTPIIQTATGGWLGVVPVQPRTSEIAVTARLPGGSEIREVRRLRPRRGGGDGDESEDRVVSVLPDERVWRPSRMGRIVDDTVFLRSGPDDGVEQAGYEFRLDSDVLVTVVGKIGRSLHVRLSQVESVWIDDFAVKLLPKNTEIPKSHVHAWTASRTERSTLLQTALNNRLPYRLTASLDGMTLTLKIYGAISNTDWFHYASGDPWIQQAAWSHPAEEVYQLDIALKQPVWGYDLGYRNSKLTLELFDPPPQPPEKSRRRALASPLEGVTVCLDPGHPPMGATGPHGTPEAVVSWALSEKLREVLETRGARVVLTRTQHDTVALPVRVKRALAAKADLFVSLHANALPPGDDPFQKNGFGVYFYQPLSLPLAESVHGALREYIPLRDDGLHFGNLHVLRQTAMPSVLIEHGYLIWPPEEDLLLDPDFQRRCALATVSGIEAFLKRRQARR
ncbi:N-acetylmuramoyl-L-alanine amidase [bacterium]|nr:N-acetylmuramoyl-L-alanine amidase [bacterium]